MLQNDKQITISTAGSRKAAQWMPQHIYWSEFVARLATPARSPESLPEYLRLPKSQQDELKDVGGFVGGALAGGRRKATAVQGRDIVTLDFDAVPAMGAGTLLKGLDSLGIAFVVYSTRKHEPARPRLRVVIPLSRTATADEYEPLARKLAEYVGIEMCDPTTFEASRLMYWPSVCAGAEYIYYYADKPFVDANGLLGLYADWRDVSTWPQVPGQQKAQERLLKKQEEPAAKEGLVGAFCRQYDIPGAMAAFLPGEYEPVAGGGRYTFAGGSTTGGAVLYGNGAFLFSHHATDPAGGRLVNSFDLVRLHKFGLLDDEAKEGTPTVRLPSYMAMCQWVEKDPVVGPEIERQRGERVLQDFGTGGTGTNSIGTNNTGTSDTETKGQAELASFLGKLRGAYVTTHMIRELLKALGISIRLNEITGKADVSGYPASWSKENAENNLPTKLLDYLKPAEVKGASKTPVCDCLDVIADENRYNPVRDMLEAARWDGIDRLPDIYRMLGVAGQLDRALIRKWLHQCVAMALNDPVAPWGAEGLLAFSGAQGIGKTSFFMMLSPLPELAKDGVSIDPKYKDTIIQAVTHWITELGELDRTTAKDHVSLKALITAATDEYRTPYARRAVTRVRRTSFCGTVNTDDFLMDDTGNRRFWVVKIKQIDLNDLFSRPQDWKLQLWAQMHQAFLQNPVGFRLDKGEREQLDTRNREYTRALDYEMEIRDLFEPDMPLEDWAELTAADVCGRLYPRPPGNRVGRVLAKLANEDERFTKRMLRGVCRYKLPMKKHGDFS